MIQQNFSGRMKQNGAMRTFGVEEELLIVDPVTGEPLALADALLAGPEAAAETGMGLSHELKLEQIETQTRPCHTYTELLQQIRRGRAMANDAARKHNARVAAIATSPLAKNTHTTPDPRFAVMLERFGLTAHEQLTCGFHVHTAVESPEEGVVVLDHIRDKLAVLTAISANSRLAWVAHGFRKLPDPGVEPVADVRAFCRVWLADCLSAHGSAPPGHGGSP